MANTDYSEAFIRDAVDKQFTISYSGGVLTNENICDESMTLKEILCGDRQLRFGSCNASCFELTIINNVAPLKNEVLTVSCKVEGVEDAPYQFGVYKVDSDMPTADRMYRDIIAYDAMYDILNAEVSEWYNSLSFPITLKDFRDSFLQHMGVEQIQTNLPNDDMIVSETIKPSELSGGTVIQAICEINGCFGHIDRSGKFQYIFLEEIVNGVYPSNDLYPAEDLYPASGTAEPIERKMYLSCGYEDYICNRIDKLQIRQEENDIGAISGTGSNCYIIEDNFLVYGMGADELKQVADNIFPVMQNVSYRPFKAEAKGNPCIGVGGQVILHTSMEIIYTYVLQRTLKGVQALRDSYSAEGEEYCTEDYNSINKRIIQLRGKTNTLIRTVEETRLEIKDIESGLDSKITQTAQKIETEVTRAKSAEESLGSRITQTAESISSEVTRATNAERNLSSKINQTAESISAEVQRATQAEGTLSSKITQTAESISSEVTRATNAESNLSSKINQTADQIELKVSKGDVSSQLSIESGQVTLKSNRFVLESTNCSISKEGNIKASNVDLSGKITASSGKIGGFTIGSIGLTSGSTGSLSNPFGVYIGTDGISCGTSGSAFKVTNAGVLTIDSASGSITLGNTSSGRMVLDKDCISFGASTNTTEITKDKIKIYNTYIEKDTVHCAKYSSANTYYTDINGDEIELHGSSTSSFLKIKSGETIWASYSGTYNIKGDSGDILIALSRNRVEVIPDNVVIGKGFSASTVGFFGSNGSSKKSITAISSTSSATASSNATKINEILTALKAYNLIG